MMDSEIITVKPEEPDLDEYMDDSSRADSGTIEDSINLERADADSTEHPEPKNGPDGTSFIALDTISYHPHMPSHVQSYTSPDTTKMHQPSPQSSEPRVVKRGRGRPRKDGTECKQRLDKEWGVEETKLLIQLWRERDVLYNQKNKDYYDKEERQKALSSIKVALDEKHVNVTEQQILEKLVSLRSYYGSQLSKIENAKANGDNMYESSWKYFHDLSFLNDSVIPRKSEMHYRNSPTPRESYSSYSMGRPLTMRLDGSGRPNSIPNPPPPTFVSGPPPSFASMLSNVAMAPSRSFPVTPQSSGQKVRVPIPHDAAVRPEMVASHKIADGHIAGVKRRFVPGPDEVFGQLISSMMGQLDDGEQKDLLKIEIQQLILKTKYAVSDKQTQQNGPQSFTAAHSVAQHREQSNHVNYNHTSHNHHDFQPSSSSVNDKEYPSPSPMMDDEYITTVVPLPE